MAEGDRKILQIDFDRWNEHVLESKATFRKVDDMHFVLNKTLAHMEHLSKLDNISEGITEMKDNLLDAVTGKDHVSTKTYEVMFSQVSRLNSFTYKILSAVILGLLGVIVFLLTGQSLGWIPPLH